VISKIWQTFPHKETKFVGKSLLYMPVKTSLTFHMPKTTKGMELLQKEPRDQNMH